MDWEPGPPASESPTLTTRPLAPSATGFIKETFRLEVDTIVGCAVRTHVFGTLAFISLQTGKLFKYK